MSPIAFNILVWKGPFSRNTRYSLCHFSSLFHSKIIMHPHPRYYSQPSSPSPWNHVTSTTVLGLFLVRYVTGPPEPDTSKIQMPLAQEVGYSPSGIYFAAVAAYSTYDTRLTTAVLTSLQPLLVFMWDSTSHGGTTPYVRLQARKSIMLTRPPLPILKHVSTFLRSLQSMLAWMRPILYFRKWCHRSIFGKCVTCVLSWDSRPPSYVWWCARPVRCPHPHCPLTIIKTWAGLLTPTTLRLQHI